MVEDGDVSAYEAVGEGLPISPLFDGFDLDFIDSVLLILCFFPLPFQGVFRF